MIVPPRQIVRFILAAFFGVLTSVAHLAPVGMATALAHATTYDQLASTYVSTSVPAHDDSGISQWRGPPSLPVGVPSLTSVSLSGFATAAGVGVAANAGGAASKPLIIGENMSRVRAYADSVGGHAYRPWENSPFDFGLGMRRNTRMIKDAVRSGREIIDIGPDFARRAAGRDPSPFYNMERRVTDGYPGYTPVFERFGKFEGGVPGLDY